MNSFNHNDHICMSCGCHQLQTCNCTWEEINKAQKEYDDRWKKEDVITTTLKDLMDQFRVKKEGNK